MAGSDAGQPSAAAEARGQTILVLRDLLAERDPDLGEHVDTVAHLCESIAPDAGLPVHERGALVEAAFLHDIGKLSLPESILGKPGSLNEGEWRLVRLHTIVGEQILVAAGLEGRVVDFVRSSHERVDGTGYPDDLAGEEIPLGSRIIAVCDAYDAMISPRPYHPIGMTSEAASLELIRSSGTQFDTGVVDAMRRWLLHGAIRSTN